METRELVLDIDGMTCASCVQKVERALGEVVANARHDKASAKRSRGWNR